MSTIKMEMPLRHPSEKPKQKRGSKSLTIGVGIKCVDGIVLCADTAITVPGSHKYYQSKLHVIDLLNSTGRVCFTFAGSPDLMNMFRDKFVDAIQTTAFDPSPMGVRTRIESTLQQIEREILNSADRGGGLQLLCAISMDNDLLLLKTSELSVHEVVFYDYVGAGDSSLIRYLTQIFLSQPVSVKVASIIASYFVTKAKVFVDGCGGDTELVQLMRDGKGHSFSGSFSEQSILMSEFYLKQYLHGVIAGASTKEESDLALKRFLGSIVNLCP